MWVKIGAAGAGNTVTGRWGGAEGVSGASSGGRIRTVTKGIAMRWVLVLTVLFVCGCFPADHWSQYLPADDPRRSKTLTVAQAEALVAAHYNLELPALVSLSPDVAEALAKHEGILVLPALATL